MTEREQRRELRTQEAEALAETERVVLAFARRERPESLQDLRARLSEAGVAVDERLLNFAILELLNSHRLFLSFDRRLSVS